MDLVKAVESEQLKEIPEFRIGDTVRVHYRIVEGKNERIQIYEGIVIARNNAGLSESFTVRKISYGVGVERVFPIHSPRVERVEKLPRRPHSSFQALLFEKQTREGRKGSGTHQEKSSKSS